nr:hypothetical protein [Tanacetum cinerariifolium]
MCNRAGPDKDGAVGLLWGVRSGLVKGLGLKRSSSGLVMSSRRWARLSDCVLGWCRVIGQWGWGVLGLSLLSYELDAKRIVGGVGGGHDCRILGTAYNCLPVRCIDIDYVTSAVSEDELALTVSEDELASTVPEDESASAVSEDVPE